MDITAPASVSTVPRHTADLRPAADAAALARNPRPILPIAVAAPSQPPQQSQVAAISRAMLDSSSIGEFPPIKEPERVLKPWGVTMLPQGEEDERKANAGQDTADQTGETDDSPKAKATPVPVLAQPDEDVVAPEQPDTEGSETD